MLPNAVFQFCHAAKTNLSDVQKTNHTSITEEEGTPLRADEQGTESDQSSSFPVFNLFADTGQDETKMVPYDRFQVPSRDWQRLSRS